ncbi:unnamed protein product [Vitrella brassicaformis CCMP3155]|uniref:type I protein arginine methyltransferase n=1 Tax=Vitrella brassicaformis (strain CCMP3155) TaxID=1169540 RepID=A0A0G4ECG8_VITBC|nr:unnamed protein product [Vitrella brassicaformis CCMP3155]|eukprot:CEL93651.1 unnamed protein product [Vitrella brassicaformis CCMP3155]
MDEYLTSYEDIDVHALMLKDLPRTRAYCDAIQQCAGLLEGKTVLDVGAGSGILSLFAARAGARRVYAVEASNMAHIAKEIVAANGLGDVVEVIHTAVEDVTLPVDAVDVIVSEWMGFYLLHESMLDSVIYARDRWLRPGGLMLPSSARLHIAMCDLSDYWREEFEWTRDFFGFDMTPLVPHLKERRFREPLIMSVDERCVWRESAATVLQLDMSKCSASELEAFQVESRLTVCPGGNNEARKVHGFLLWFDVGFPSVSDKEQPVVLSTAPWQPQTHWKQARWVVIPLPEPMSVCEMVADERAGEGGASCGAAGVRVSSALRFVREGGSRNYTLDLEITDVQVVKGTGE